MEIIRRKKPGNEHPYVPELRELYRQGKISRRDFLRHAALLGASLAAGEAFLAGCLAPAVAPTVAAPTQPASAATSAPANTAVPPAAATGTAVPPTAAAAAAATQQPTVKRGGSIKIANYVIGIDHPARFSRGSEAFITCGVIQYLTLVDHENIVRPYLAESWQASDDLKTWTLNLRKQVKWSTGETFNADDVVFTMNQWLTKDVGSSTLGLMDYLQPANIEKVDDYTVRLHLASPQIAVPYHLFAMPNAILDHRTFEGNWLKNPVGTGPYTLQEWKVGERAVLVARKDGCWQTGADGKPLPYLDQITYVDLGSEETARVSALRDGTVDVLSELYADGFQALQGDPKVAIERVTTGTTALLRMRSDVEPYTDVRVRKALKLCQDRAKILKLSYFGEGMIAADTHASPVQPDYSPIEPSKYDAEQAKALLTQAGYPNGVDITITVGSGWPDQVRYAEILKEDAAPAGFRINIKPIPIDTYWDQWTEIDLGITGWNHRALAILTLPVAYTCGADGKPVPWNETHWCDEEFAALLLQAEGTLDVEKRRALMAKIEQIQVDRGSVGIAFWRNQWVAHSPKVKGLTAHPTEQKDEWLQAWYDPAA